MGSASITSSRARLAIIGRLHRIMADSTPSRPEQRERILDLTFGSDGLKPGLVKMFLDPFQEGMSKPAGDGPSRFDHETTTKWMRYFVREGLNRTRARGADLQIVTTMYGPPPWTTKQKFIRGRDLDPAEKEEVARYMISWVKYLRDVEKFPVKYVSLHNEGEGLNRWPADGATAGTPNHDYNMWWPSTQVVEFLRFMRPMMDREGLQDVGLTPGETSNWEAFGRWYAYFIQTDPVALKNLGLITSHGFGLGLQANNSLGVDLLRLSRPDLHAWATSMSFGKMDVNFVEMVRQNIYASKVNALIPWAYIQTDDWTGGDPNPGTAFRVDGKGHYTGGKNRDTICSSNSRGPANPACRWLRSPPPIQRFKPSPLRPAARRIGCIPRFQLVGTRRLRGSCARFGNRGQVLRRICNRSSKAIRALRRDRGAERRSGMQRAAAGRGHVFCQALRN